LSIPKRDGAIRILACALAACLLAAAGAQLWRLRQAKSEIRRLLALAPGGTSDEIHRILRFARDPAEAQLGVAWQLLARAAEGTPGLEPAIETLAEAAKARRPQSFEAETVLGLARFLRLERSRDERIYKERAIWEAPLLRARSLAPDESEPLQALVRTRLRIWFALSDAERAETRTLVAASFLDRGFYYSMHGRWLELNLADPNFALAALPDRPGAWLHAQSAYHSMKAWHPLLLARRGWHAASLRALVQPAAEPQSAEERLDLLVHSPANRQTAPAVSLLLERLTREELRQAPADGLLNWWTWSLERTLAGEAGLSPEALRRLAGALGGRPPQERALAALAAGDLRQAEALEAQPDAPGPLWDDYYLAKIGLLKTRGETQKAVSTLALLTRKESLRARLASGLPPAPRPSGANEVSLAEPSSSGNMNLETWFEASAAGFLVALAPRGGSGNCLVELSTDGTAPDVVLLTRSQEVRLRRPMAPGFHTLAVRTVFGEAPLVERVAAF